jgi:urea transport system substrate-binding protein
MKINPWNMIGATALGLTALPAMAQDCPVKVGVLHSLSGTMAISETTLKDTMLMLIDQQNEKGGVLGCEIEPVVVDPASDWPLFAEKARELLTVNEVDVIFGSWTSVSRKSALPVLEELNGLMFYPVQYEGEESSKNVFYTGAAPNQQAIPAVDYYLEELGIEKFALLGTDYVYPRTTNNILKQYLMDKGIPEDDIFVNYTPFGHSDWSTIVSDVVELGEDGSFVGVVSTINGDANVGFYKELAASTAPIFPWWPSRSVRKSFQASTPRTSWGTWRRGTISSRPIPRPTRNGSPHGKRAWAKTV